MSIKTLNLFQKYNLLEKIFFLGVFFSPFIFSPNSSLPYEIPRVHFIRFWIGILTFFSFFRLKDLSKRKKGGNFLIIFPILFLVAIFSSSIFGVDFDKSFWGNYFRGDGLLTFTYLVGLSIILSLYWKRSWLPSLFKTIALSSLLISIWAIFQSKLATPPTISFGQPNFLAGYLLITLPFTIHLSKSGRYKERWLLAIVVQVAAILTTYSKVAILGLLVLFLFYKFLKFNNVLKTLSLVFLTIVVALSAFFAFWVPREINPNNYLAESRGRIARKGIIAFSRSPLLGWGWANFDHAFDSIDYPIKFNDDVYVDKAHSHFLEILVTSGVLGLTFYLLLIALVIKKLMKTRTDYGKTLLFSFLLFVVHTQTNVISIAEELIFWVITGIAVSNTT